MDTTSNQPKLRYVENSLHVITRHGNGRFYHYPFMSSDEIEVYFSIQALVDVTITSLTLFGIYFMYGERVEHKEHTKVFNNVYPFDCESPSFKASQRGPLDFGLLPFTEPYDFLLGDINKGYVCHAHQQLTIAFRDIPSLAYMRKKDTRTVYFKIEIYDMFSHHSEITLSQHLVYQVNGYDHEQSHICIGPMECVTLSIYDTFRKQHSTYTNGLSSSQNSAYLLSRISLTSNKSLFYYRFQPSLQVYPSSNSLVYFFLNNPNRSYYISLLATSSHVVQKEKLLLTSFELQLAQTFYSYPGGITYSLFDALHYVPISNNPIMLVGAYLHKRLHYVFLTHLKQSMYPEDPLVFQQTFFHYTTGALFLHAQYEQLPYALISTLT